MRFSILSVCTALLLPACQHYSTLDANDFERGKVSQVQFERDNYECGVAATVQQNMAGGNSDSLGIYNDTYAGCMEKRGYRTTNIDLLGFGG